MNEKSPSPFDQTKKKHDRFINAMITDAIMSNEKEETKLCVETLIQVIKGIQKGMPKAAPDEYIRGVLSASVATIAAVQMLILKQEVPEFAKQSESD